MKDQNHILWLQSILKAQGCSQKELAAQLDVTEVALNRWLHQKTVPHPKTIQKIRELYQRSAFAEELESSFDLEKWQKKFLSVRDPEFVHNFRSRKDLYDDTLLRLTYHTNRIEGSTLTLKETQTILFDNSVVPRHTLVEHLEVSNHQLAFQELMKRLEESEPINVSFVLSLHEILMKGILEDAGRFRRHSVRIVGARVIPPNYIKVPEKMEELCEKMEATQDPVGILCQHALFEAIHPFSDGNGRIGRLLLNYQFLRAGYPIIIIHSERRAQYYEALEKAQVDRVYEPLVKFGFEERKMKE